MIVVAAVLVGIAILAVVWYDTARLITPNESRCPPLARLRGRRAELGASERWLAGLLRHGRIDAAEYRWRMSGLAHGERRPAATGGGDRRP